MNFEDIDQPFLRSLVCDSLLYADGGEMFIESVHNESLIMDNGILSSADYKSRSGFALRSFSAESVALVHSSDLSKQRMSEASKSIKLFSNAAGNSYASLNNNNGEKYYSSANPLTEEGFSFENKIKILLEIHNYIKNKSQKVVQITLSLIGNYQEVMIIDNEGKVQTDIRPLVRLNIAIVMTNDGVRFESGYEGCGGRYGYLKLLNSWRGLADEAIRKAELNLHSVVAPSGEMPVVLASGWPGIILHEAIGHGLESDFNRKKTSVFSSLIGKRIASDEVNVVDDGTIKEARGSINIDDEGTPSSCTSLIKNGILVGYMYDKVNANLMGTQSTGNGRRESYLHLPLPRMTNTYMLPGKYKPEELIASVEKGVYAVGFSGGQVDITSGKFIFSTSEAYLLENGKITSPLKGVTLIGSGEEILKEIDMVADDWLLDSGIGTCSKDGQNMPVGVGQPSIRVKSITVGGG